MFCPFHPQRRWGRVVSYEFLSVMLDFGKFIVMLIGLIIIIIKLRNKKK